MTRKLTIEEVDYNLNCKNLIRLSKYINAREDLNVMCKVCNFIYWSAYDCLRKNGCKKCFLKLTNDNQRLSISTFIEKANTKHNNKYDYSKVFYINNSTEVIIICKFHGEFNQLPANHLAGHGCDKCAHKVTTSHTRYTNKIIDDYLKKNCLDLIRMEEYTNSNDKIRWKHKCGYIWEATWDNIKRYIKISVNCGCPDCSKRFSQGEHEWLNYLKIPNNKKWRQVRIGKYIADGFDKKTNTVYEYYGDRWHGNPDIYDLEDINSINKKTYGELYQKTLEKEAYYSSLGYKLIKIWDSEWRKMKKAA